MALLCYNMPVPQPLPLLALLVFLKLKQNVITKSHNLNWLLKQGDQYILVSLDLFTEKNMQGVLLLDRHSKKDERTEIFS